MNRRDISGLKAHLNIDHSEDDELLSQKLSAAWTYIDCVILNFGHSEQDLLLEAAYQLAAHWYSQREAAAEHALHPIPYGVSEILSQYRQWEF